MAAAALREPGLPEARLSGPEHDVRLLVDHRDDLVGERTRTQNRLRWHCHDLGVGRDVPPKALARRVWLDRLAAELAGMGTGVQVAHRGRPGRAVPYALGRDRPRSSARWPSSWRELAPQLLAEPGCGALLAARLLGETAGACRFTGEAAFAMHAGTAPLPVSSGQSSRHRLNRRGNRRLNAAIHMMAVTQVRMHPPARAFMARKQAEGKSKREALRCLKRYIARSVFGILRDVDRAGPGSFVEVVFPAPVADLAAPA